MMRSKKYVLLLGGYGYGNVGDEAQLSQNIELWKKYAPEFKIIILSPYPDYSTKTHRCKSLLASREVFFNANSKSFYWRENFKFKTIYFYKYFKFTISCYIKKKFSTFFFLTSKELNFLNLLNNAQYVHFCGGGYLTGKTKSRLWDGVLIMNLCRILKKTYFMTGQTIGLFENNIDKFLSWRGFNGAKKISLRDPKDSKNELLKIGVKSEMTSLGDDAIFSPKTSDFDFQKFVKLNNINMKKNYVCVHYHNWGMNAQTLEESHLFFFKLITLLKKKYNLDSLLIPMTPDDEIEQKTLKKNMKLQTKIFNYNYDFKVMKKLISKSQFIISLKHHPLIFSLGESVPAISICYDDYYLRKNTGAMKNFGLGEFVLSKSNVNIQNIENLIHKIISKKKKIIKGMNIYLRLYKKKQKFFFISCL